jgi:hypothetical protein
MANNSQLISSKSCKTDSAKRKNLRRNMLLGPLKYKNICFKLICLFALTTLSFNFSSAQSSPKRVALLPFKINAEKDMTFLQNGIFDMLTSRLSKEGEVVVIQLNADYSLFGSLTVLGNSISIDAKMVDVTGNTPTTSFFEQSQDLGGVITKINGIAAQINTNVFDRQPQVARQAAPATQTPETDSAPKKDDAQAHPEKLVKGHGTQGEGSPFITATEEGEGAAFQKFWRSASFKHLINGISMGDVDGDGKIETVVVTPNEVIVYRAESGKFYKAHEIKDSGSRYHIGVDVADINENGFPEIFVTGN